METTIPTFGVRELIGIIITLTAVIAFLLSVIKLTLTKRQSAVNAGYNPENGGFHINTQNLSIVTLCVSAILLAVMGTAAFAEKQEQWVYLGKGYDNNKWNFRSLEGDQKFAANQTVKATKKVKIRNAAFGNFTKTWLSMLSPPEPKVTGQLAAGDCAKVHGFSSVGLNKVWMRITPVKCPRNQ
ncbi:hypothetical protein [Agarilytica rhodophyticola]|uniref:hypothetical protein n=1 Tax=Agarilytica rhodophyticola TaxID=1737490 RepID=UPI000B34468C|nr:hypothetical protein [Agarilytica rhodophyticola]